MNEPEFKEPEFDAIIAPEEALIVELDGFEGPLDLLLALARNQKVDIAKISVLQLADQYLAFIEAAAGRRLELAADYLVMAAWLTYFKSRLVLPQIGGKGFSVHRHFPDLTGIFESPAQVRLALQRMTAGQAAVIPAEATG